MGEGRQHPAFGNNSDYLPALGDRKVVLMSEQHTSHFIRAGMCRQDDERRTILYAGVGDSVLLKPGVAVRARLRTARPTNTKTPTASAATRKKVALTADARTAPAASTVNATRLGTGRDERCQSLLKCNAVLMIRLPRKFVTSGIEHSLCKTSRSKRNWL